MPDLQTRLRKKALSIAKHECGHWLMAARLDFMPVDITITIINLADGYCGGTSIILQNKIKSLADLKSYVRRRVGVLFAGTFAESLSRVGKVDLAFAKNRLEGDRASNPLSIGSGSGSAQDDFGKIRELLSILRSAQYGTPSSEAEHECQLRELQTPIWNRSGEIIEEDSTTILCLGEAIAARVQAIATPFGMKGYEIRNLPSIKDWLVRVHKDRYWEHFP